NTSSPGAPSGLLEDRSRPPLRSSDAREIGIPRQSVRPPRLSAASCLLPSPSLPPAPAASGGSTSSHCSFRSLLSITASLQESDDSAPRAHNPFRPSRMDVPHFGLRAVAPPGCGVILQGNVLVAVIRRFLQWRIHHPSIHPKRHQLGQRRL